LARKSCCSPPDHQNNLTSADRSFREWADQKRPQHAFLGGLNTGVTRHAKVAAAKKSAFFAVGRAVRR